jgi:hypothetical protein
MIKPEDITDELVMDRIDDEVTRSWPDFIARRLNAAIETGIVSPPVFTVRDKAGNLLDDAAYGLYASPESAESKHEDGYIAEHWKGQTE